MEIENYIGLVLIGVSMGYSICALVNNVRFYPQGIVVTISIIIGAILSFTS